MLLYAISKEARETEQASLALALLNEPDLALSVRVDSLRAAVEAAVKFRISYWNAAVIEAARLLGCDEVLTADLNDGQNYGGVRVRSPFRKGGKRRR